MPREPARRVQPIAFVRPPAVHAVSDEFVMALPIIADVLLVELLTRRGWNLPVKRRIIPLQRHDVQDDVQMFRVQIIDHRRGGADEHVRVELKRIVSKVPARGAKSGAEKNESVARQIVFPKLPRFGEDVRLGWKCATRLHVTERPFGRHHRRAGQPHKFAHCVRRVASVGHKNVCS